MWYPWESGLRSTDQEFRDPAEMKAFHFGGTSFKSPSPPLSSEASVILITYCFIERHNAEMMMMMMMKTF